MMIALALLLAADRPVIDLSGGRVQAYPLAMARPLGVQDIGVAVQSVLSQDFERSGLFRLLDPASFLAPPSARQPQVTGWHGAQQVVPGKDGTRVRADVGGGRVVQVRWREAFTGTPVVRVREAAVWDVSEADLNLTACYLVRVEQGAVSRLQFDLPEELEPTRVVVRQQDAAGGSAAALRDWSLGPARDRLRRLRLDFQAAAGGRLLVVIECSPRTVPTRQPHLRFPRPIGMTPEADPVYGLRANRVGVGDDVPHTAVVKADATALAPFNAVTDLRLDPAVPVKVFRPQPRGTPELRPVVQAGPDPPTVTQEVTWRVGVGRADGEGAIRWKDAAPPALEFQLPGSVRVVEVRGPDVAGWSAAGGRVQVWFRRAAKSGAVEWVGTHAAAAGKAPADSAAFDPPVPRVTGARPGTESVRVTPADGVAVEIGPAPGWTVAHPAGWRGWSLRAEGSPAPPRFHLFATRPAGAARGFALVEPGRDGLSYRGVVQVPVRPGRPHHLVVSVSGLPAGAAADLEAPPGTRVTVRTGEGSARAWDLDVPASEAAVFRAAVAVKLPAGTLQLPAVAAGVGGEPPDPAGVVRLVGVTGRDRPAALAGASPAPPAVLDRVRKEWPAESDRLRVAGGSVWAVAAGSPPRLVVGATPGSAAEPGPAATAPPEPTAHTAPADHGSGRWAAGLAAGWLLAVAGLAALAGRFPRATWPEQLGLLGALFGLAVAGGWWVGLATELFARLAWLLRAAVGAFSGRRSG